MGLGKKKNLPLIYPTNVTLKVFAKDYWRQFSTVERNWLLKSHMFPNAVVKTPISRRVCCVLLVVSILLLLSSSSHQAQTRRTLALPSSYTTHPSTGTNRWCGRNTPRIRNIWISCHSQCQREDTGTGGWLSTAAPMLQGHDHARIVAARRVIYSWCEGYQSGAYQSHLINSSYPPIQSVTLQVRAQIKGKITATQKPINLFTT